MPAALTRPSTRRARVGCSRAARPARPSRRRVAHVERRRVRRGAGIGLGVVPREVGGDHPRAGRGERGDGRGADPGRCPGDHDRPSIHRRHRRLPPLRTPTPSPSWRPDAARAYDGTGDARHHERRCSPGAEVRRLVDIALEEERMANTLDGSGSPLRPSQLFSCARTGGDRDRRDVGDRPRLGRGPRRRRRPGPRRRTPRRRPGRRGRIACASRASTSPVSRAM